MRAPPLRPLPAHRGPRRRGGRGPRLRAGSPGGDVDAFLRADREFHLASYSAAPPGETAQIIGRMWNTTQHYRREFTGLAARQAGLGATYLEHRLLVDCLRREDADDAERVLVMHIRRTRLELSRHPEIFG